MAKIFTEKDGELRIYDGTSGGTHPFYMSLLFTNSDLSFPIARGRPEENLTLNRGNMDSNAHYSEGSDEPLLEPLPVTFSLSADDSVNTSYLADLLSGVTTINSKELTSTKGTSAVTVSAGVTVTTPTFSDDQKVTYNAEIFWDGSTDLGFKLEEVFFDPKNQTVNEGADSVSVNANGMIYGQISRISAFTSGTTIAN